MPTFRDAEAESTWRRRTEHLPQGVAQAGVAWMDSMEEQIERQHLTLRSPSPDPRLCLATYEVIKVGFENPLPLVEVLTQAAVSWVYGERLTREQYSYERGWSTLFQQVLEEFSAAEPWAQIGNKQREHGFLLSRWRDDHQPAQYMSRLLSRYYVSEEGHEVHVAAMVSDNHPNLHRLGKYEGIVRWYNQGIPGEYNLAPVPRFYANTIEEVQRHLDKSLASRGILPTVGNTKFTLPFDHDEEEVREALLKGSGARFYTFGNADEDLPVYDEEGRLTGLNSGDL